MFSKTIFKLILSVSKEIFFVVEKVIIYLVEAKYIKIFDIFLNYDAWIVEEKFDIA